MDPSILLMGSAMDTLKLFQGMENKEGQFVFFLDTLAIPTLATGLSCFILFLQVLLSTFANRKQQVATYESEPDQNNYQLDASKSYRNIVGSNGGANIFTFKTLRLISCLTLLVTSLYTTRSNWHVPTDSSSILHLGLSITFAYTVLLALVNMLSRGYMRVFGFHLSSVLLIIWAIFMYRNVWPLATYTLAPSDVQEGWLIWFKIATLSLAAVIVPLFIPRRYTPFDPKNPVSVTNPEQTASIISFVSYAFMDSVISQAWRTPHLTVDDLAPLPDQDETKNLIGSGFKLLDPLQSKKERHLFWGLLQIFHKPYGAMSVLLVLRGLSSFAAPYGLKRFLSYLEHPTQETLVRPWVWIIWLFLGPATTSIIAQWYSFIASRSRVQYQALLTQLIFEHTLRMRVKSDISSPGTSNANGSNNMSSTSSSSSSTGKLLNLMTSDMENLERGKDFLEVFFYNPMQVALSIYFLFTILGTSVIPGAILMAVAVTVPGYFSSRIHSIQIEKMKKSDARIQSATDAISVIRMVKLFGWEQKMSEQIDQKRVEELKLVRELKLLRGLNGSLNFLVRFAVTIFVFFIHAVVLKREFTASTVFSSLIVLEMLGERLEGFFGTIPAIITAKVSLDRINDFLRQTELLDSYTPTDLESEDTPEDDITMCASKFTWTSDEMENTPDAFSLVVEGEITFENNQLHLITGPTGCGKTSLLLALLGEMHCIPLGENSKVTLPRAGGVAYHAQEPWIFSDTIRSNIVFRESYDEERYNTVIEQCCLQEDLEYLDAGDQTEVGEKGVTLSGGQKARVSLARAVYSTARVLLLDDVFAALDVRTTRWIVERCFGGDLMSGRTIVLVTHQVGILGYAASSLTSLDLNGNITKRKLDKATILESAPVDTITIPEVHEHSFTSTEKTKGAGQLIAAEEVEIGHVRISALKLFFGNISGTVGSIAFAVSILILESVGQFCGVMETWSLSLWTKQYDIHNPSDIPVLYYLGLYLLFSLGSVTLTTSASVVFLFGSIQASRRIHDILVHSVLGSTWRWLDTTPTSRIIVRFAQDIQAVDGPLAAYFSSLFGCSMQMVFRFTAILIVTPSFAFPGIIIGGLGVAVGQAYMKAQLPLKRETSITRSVVIKHLATAISGLVSIRAYGVEGSYASGLYHLIDQYSRAARTSSNLNKWITVRIDLLGALFVASLATYLLYGDRTDASVSGFSLTLAVSWCGLLFWWVRVLNDAELECNSLERIDKFTKVKQEPTEAKSVPPAYWPTSGELVVENLSARYSANGPLVLKNISFRVNSGERIGLVGRTGSGKSSLILSLLRCIPTEGEVYFDGVAIHSISPNDLRSKVTVIPQVPELLHGTLRYNLDPFSQYDDAELNDVLKSSGLSSLQDDSIEAARITLDSIISGGGTNLSVGQRQIIALARALLRRSKLIILDEATSAIDNRTDSIIQMSLRRTLEFDVSVITVAHRLHTIMDADKIIVLDAGRIVEMGHPGDLVIDKQSKFYGLVMEDGDRETLLRMAKGNIRSS